MSLRRSARAIDAWIAAAAVLAGADAETLREPLLALRAESVAALGGSASARAASGAPTPRARRAVPSAIDRVTDGFLAADADTGAIVDANPATCARLGLSRPELLARTLDALAAPADRADFAHLLDAIAEGADDQRAQLSLVDATATPSQRDFRAMRGCALAPLLGRR